MSEPREVLRLSGLRKAYNPGTPLENEVLHGLDFRLHGGELTALIGPSGSGKSTLLNLIGLLDSPTGGELYLLGQPTSPLDDAAPPARVGWASAPAVALGTPWWKPWPKCPAPAKTA